MQTAKLSRHLVAALGALVLVDAGVAAEPPPGAGDRSGIDKSNFNATLRPQDDFYHYVNGGWLAHTPIPADLSNYGAFTVLTVAAEQIVHRLLEQAAAEPAKASPQARKAAALYTSFMDEKTIEARGLKPLATELARIDALRTVADVSGYLGHVQTLGIDEPLIWYVQPDPRDASSYLSGLAQGGLSLPDRDYYLRDEPKYAAYREQLGSYCRQLLQLAGDNDAAAHARVIAAIEQRLAGGHWTRVQNRDPVATYNKLDLPGLAAMAPAVVWSRFFADVGAPVTVVNVDQPGYLKALNQLLVEVPVADWRSYFRYRLLDGFAPYLPARFAQAHFEFHDQALSGVKQQRERWKRGVSLTNEAVGEITGQMYVEAAFSPQSRQRMQTLVTNLLRSFATSIDSLSWMTPATRVEAHQKLAAMNTKIGYPDRWRDYSALRVEAGDLLGNVLRAAQFEQQRQRGRLGKPVDRGEWHMTPQTVNAYYSQTMNEIVFPAAILQPPFFDPQVEDAAIYGAIGAVIGHEISHAFDDKGSQFDGKGNLRDWWTPEDAKLFKQRTAALSAQFSGYTVLDGQHVNGELTLGENIADLSGLAIAYKAYQLSLGDHPGPVIDGMTAPQRFFTGWAQIWRRNFRDDNLRLRLSVDPHSPDPFRVNGTVPHIDAFYDAFSLQPGDRLYLRPEERIRIW